MDKYKVVYRGKFGWPVTEVIEADNFQFFSTQRSISFSVSETNIAFFTGVISVHKLP